MKPPKLYPFSIQIFNLFSYISDIKNGKDDTLSVLFYFSAT